MVVPRYFDVDRLHRIDEAVDGAAHRSLAGATEVIVHFDPCRPRLCPTCQMVDCQIREAGFQERFPWSQDRATRRDEFLETGVPVPQRGPFATSTVEAFVGLGSNLGDRAGHLRAALRGLAETPGTEVIDHSHVYETDPVGPPPQASYLNAVVKLRTTLGPGQLLSRLLEIEVERGRRRGAERNAARTLDLDLLDYDGRRLSLEQPRLELPHPRLAQRPFVLEPLAELAGDRVHPGSGERFADLAARVRDDQAVRPWRGGEGDDPWRSWP